MQKSVREHDPMATRLCMTTSNNSEIATNISESDSWLLICFFLCIAFSGHRVENYSTFASLITLIAFATRGKPMYG